MIAKSMPLKPMLMNGATIRTARTNGSLTAKVMPSRMSAETLAVGLARSSCIGVRIREMPIREIR